MKYQHVLCFVLVAVFFLATGCGKPNPLGVMPVKGVVTLDGSPVSGATVIFNPVSTSGVVASGTTNDAGEFKLSTAGAEAETGAQAGDYKVTVRKVQVASSVTESDNPFVSSSPDPKGSKVTEELPVKYKAVGTTDLEATVQKGKNEFTFALTK